MASPQIFHLCCLWDTITLLEPHLFKPKPLLCSEDPCVISQASPSLSFRHSLLLEKSCPRIMASEVQVLYPQVAAGLLSILVVSLCCSVPLLSSLGSCCVFPSPPCPPCLLQPCLGTSHKQGPIVQGTVQIQSSNWSRLQRIFTCLHLQRCSCTDVRLVKTLPMPIGMLLPLV